MKVLFRILFVALFACTISAAAPEIGNVEPPNWRANQVIGGKEHPLRMLIRGRNLTGANVIAPTGFKVSNLKTNAAGAYLFSDLAINKNTPPSDYIFKVKTNDGAADLKFTIAAALPKQGNFQGFSQDDVIY